ncbi:MAG: hypothetical protein JSV89_04495 [Spirochaetaceae bacterium]|nr:MAG: hypothetical protein JSV89_04495 [Spirochaetaceae bacterium]
MGVLREEMLSGDAVLRIDVMGVGDQEHVLEEMTFLNYRLASVQSRKDIKKAKPDMIWDRQKSRKDIRYQEGQLLMDGDWEQGELNKIIVTMLAFEMDKVGLHPFHSSAVRYRDRSILFLGGENNHGKSMSQIEGCRRGGKIISTETTVTDDEGIVVMGSKSVYLRIRAKGTERADLPSQDQGVAKFFDKEPEFIIYEDSAPVDLVIMPGIDGHFDTKVVEMNRFEREYQSYHSVMNYFGLNQLLAPGGIVMPVVDTDELRQKRGDFVSRFAADKPYFMVRAKTPQLLFDEVEKLM